MCSTASGASSASARAVAAAPSTGPIPHASPVRPSSSRSVAATRRTPDTRRSYARRARPRRGQLPRCALAPLRQWREPEDRVPRRLGLPLRLTRVERDVEERTRYPAEREVAPEHRDGVGGIELLDAVPLRVAATAELYRRRGARVPDPAPLAGGCDEPAPGALRHDRDGCRPRPPADSAGNRQQVGSRPGQAEPSQRANEAIEPAPPEAMAVLLRQADGTICGFYAPTSAGTATP